MKKIFHGMPVALLRTMILFSLFLVSSKILCAQITYPDSCLKVEFYYKTKQGRLDTLRTLTIKGERNNFESMYWNDNQFNLVVLFRNICNQKIAIPSEVKFSTDFWIQGLRIDSSRNDTLDVALAVDYLKGTSGSRDEVVEAKQMKILPYPFPLGLKIKSKGVYKFRLEFHNSHNYIPFDEWKTYYSNWLYLKLL
jgi:hypothetical protein